MADDTDVYILLLHNYQTESLRVPMKLQSTQSGRAVIDITATVNHLQSIIPELLPAHALTGCDTVSMCHGIGETKMFKALEGGKCSLSLMGDLNVTIESITKQATVFMCWCYNIPDANTIT